MEHESEPNSGLQSIPASPCLTESLETELSSQVNMVNKSACRRNTNPCFWQKAGGYEAQGETSTTLSNVKAGLAVVLPHRSNGWFYFSAGGAVDSCAGGSGGGR